MAAHDYLIGARQAQPGDRTRDHEIQQMRIMIGKLQKVTQEHESKITALEAELEAVKNKRGPGRPPNAEKAA